MIKLLYNAESVIGAIGGGMCNILFTKREVPITVIVSPTFLDINSRFKYCFCNKNIKYFTDTRHIETGSWKKYIRVKIPSRDIIGEITDVRDNSVVVSYLNNKVAGWNNDMHFKTIEISKSECVPLDNGLNSAWSINLQSFK